MPRLSRIIQAGFYHVINRGVERRVVFYEEDDFDTFLDILNLACIKYNITLHAFCLMNNHYHLLIETKEENLSKAMKYINENYAVYFNKRYNRSGHLWQGRFFSSLLFNDQEHFWIVARYIEQNPIRANIVKQIDHYKYQSLFQLKYSQKYDNLLKNSDILSMEIKSYQKFITENTDCESQVEQTYASPKIIKQNNKIKVLTKKIDSFFDKYIDNKTSISNAFNYGYSKTDIANFTNLSAPAISKILKR